MCAKHGNKHDSPVEGTIFESPRPKEYLLKLDEDELIDKVIIPLFQRYNWQLIKKAKHREGELGKDLVFKETTDFGANYYAIQVKAKKIDSSNIMDVVKQIEIALRTKVRDISKNVYVSFVFLITSKNITNDAEKVLSDNFSAKTHVRFYDGERLLDMVKKVANDELLVFIREIENILDKRSTFQEHPISLQGPSWKDFETKNIIERPVVNEILKSIRAGNNHILILGPPASGKTVLANHIGFNQSKFQRVFQINADDITATCLPHIMKEIQTVRRTQPMLILEDAHRNPESCNALLEAIEKLGVNVVITARPSYKIDFPMRRRNYIARLEAKPNTTCFMITSEPIIKPLVQKRLGKKAVLFHERLASECGGDLWILTYYLSAMDGDELDIDHVLKRIHSDLLRIEKHIPESLTVIFTLSVFFQYEIQIEKQYLINRLDIGYDTLVALLREGLVLENRSKDSCYLRHSSIASIYLRVARRYNSILRLCNLLNTDEDNLEKFLFEDYLRFNPGNIFTIVRGLRYNNDMLEFLIMQSAIRKVAFEKINNLQTTNETVAGFLSDFTRVTSDHVRIEIEKQIKPENYAERINREVDLRIIGCLLNCLPWDVSTTGRSLVDESNAAVGQMRQKCREDTDEQMGYCDWVVAWGTFEDVRSATRKVLSKYETGKKTSCNMTLLNHFAFCSKASHSRIINICVKSMFCTASELYRRILRYIDLSVLVKKVNAETDIYEICHIINNIYWLDESFGKALVAAMDKETLAEKISTEGSAAILSFLFRNLSRSLERGDFQYLLDSISNDKIKHRMLECRWV